MNQDLLRIIDSIARDKNIEKDSIYADIEASLLSAARKFYGETDDVVCTIDRMTGEIEVRKTARSLIIASLAALPPRPPSRS